MRYVFHNIQADNFCRKKKISVDRHQCAPPWVSGSIVLHVCMCKGMIFVFHKIHSEKTCRPPPLRTTMGHPQTTTQCYAPDSGVIVPRFCMCKGMIFVFHKIHSEKILHTATTAHQHGSPADNHASLRVGL
jgi:hypothetical protein